LIQSGGREIAFICGGMHALHVPEPLEADLSRRRKVSCKEDAETASKNVKKLLADPVAFEKWVKKPPDMSRLRRRR
jgi:hypothetical protein